MKRIILAMAMLGLAFSGAQRAEAGVDVSVDFFYNNLNDGGNWIEVGDYGYCWQPSVAISNPRWRPYSDGYWAYTDVGWTWVSYEDFGWATYHYGRWSRLRNHGWVWVPGREWAPAWVSWRTGGDYVGWAPLPPRYGGRRGESVYEGRAIGNTVDLDFDIGPAYYNFVNVRYIGEPVLRERIFAPTQNITYINNTVNVTNIRYENSTVYNYGPDYNRLSAYSTRPIQRLRLERAQNVDFATAGRSGALAKVQGDRLIVAAPPATTQTAVQTASAPKAVKTRIAKPDVETGWSGVADANAKTELQQKMKKEDPKSVPPAQLPPTNPAALSAAGAPAPAAQGASPAAAVSPASTVAPNDRGKGKDRRGQPAQTAVSPAAGAMDTGAAPSPIDQRARATNKNQSGGNVPAAQSTAPPQDGVADPGALPNETKGKGVNKTQRRGNVPVAQPTAAPQNGAATPGASPNETKDKGKDMDKRGGNGRAGRSAVTPQNANAPAAGARKPASEMPQDKATSSEIRGEERSERLNQPTATADAAARSPQANAAPVLRSNNRNTNGRQKDVSTPAVDRAPAASKAGAHRNSERAAAPAPSEARGPVASAPTQQAPRGVERQKQPAPPQNAAPSKAGKNAPQDAGKPGKGKKDKKGEGTPEPTPGQ